MSRRLAGWRPSLRMAWRDAGRARGRSVLVLVMIALPVLGVTAADIILQTARVSGGEALERRVGGADAKVQFQRGTTQVVQGFDPEQQVGYTGGGANAPAPDASDIARVLGRDVRSLLWLETEATVVTDKGRANAAVSVLELRDPLTTGIFRIDAGVAPSAPDEVFINADLAERGFALGDQLEVTNRGSFTVVGIGESTSYRDFPRVVGLDPALAGADETRSPTYLVDAGPVSWDEVLRLNAIGGTVVSRAVLLDPPPTSALSPEVQSWGSGVDDATVAVAALVVVMALIEVVLLAGPAFAVGARRQARTLALLAASGGTPRQARRVVLASGVVLGGLGAVLGVVLGILVALAALPVLQRFSGSWFGPFDVPWLHLVGIAGFGLLSAFLAALVPAWLASGQDVVAVLAGRRGDKPGGLRSPLVGVLLLAAGIAGSAYGVARASQGELVIAAAAIPSVLGMILLIPVVLRLLASLSGKLPLTLRYAVRDAARHRTRTVPAVAAVAATVAGVVALGVANTSDAAQNEANYMPSLAKGHAAVTSWKGDPDRWERFQAVLERELPGAEVSRIEGVLEEARSGDQLVTFRADGKSVYLEGVGATLGSSVLVSEAAGPGVLPGLSAADRARAQEALDAGGAVVWTAKEVTATEVAIRASIHDGRGEAERLGSEVLPAAFVQPDSWMAPGRAVLAPAAARDLGLDLGTAGLLVAGPVTEQQERDVSEGLAAITQHAGIYVERGYTPDDDAVILLLVLGGLGALLMLGGTLTATFLALSDARPDLATLAAVGASPRTRRGVAASYAMVVGLTGALLGAAVGFIPGIAITYPLTGGQWSTEVSGAGHHLAVPWLLIASLVLALPLVTAAVVGLTARSRLPLVARLD